MILHNKIIVITGASSGIGAEMARLLSRHGATIAMIARSGEKMRDVAAGLSGEYGVYTADITSTDQVNSTIEAIVTRYGRIDILINNAGFGVFATFMETPIKQFEEMMDVNYYGIIRVTKSVLPHMMKAGSGQLINVASLAGLIGTAKSTAYSATKHAVLGFTNSLRHEVRGFGITVSAVNPGPIDTPFFNIADPSGDYIKKLKGFILRPEAVAEAVLDVILHKKAEKNIPRMAVIGVKLFQLFPRLFDKLFSKMMNQK